MCLFSKCFYTNSLSSILFNSTEYSVNLRFMDCTKLNGVFLLVNIGLLEDVIIKAKMKINCISLFLIYNIIPIKIQNINLN